MTWLMLNPREVSIVTDPSVTPHDSSNGDLLRIVREKLNYMTGDLELTDNELTLVRSAARNWQGGYQRQFEAVLQAVRRHV